ncbi:MAG: hypothetical protein K2J90_06290 [Lachnospiraceae bacterium]|nr:hypothetical protein [Lachnospiraceae bacterium]
MVKLTVGIEEMEKVQIQRKTVEITSAGSFRDIDFADIQKNVKKPVRILIGELEKLLKNGSNSIVEGSEK